MNRTFNQDTAPDGRGERSGMDQLESLKAELDAARDRYLRTAADFDNFRKRTERESERRAGLQKEGFIEELLPIIDNLERALASKASSSSEQVRQGVAMTLQQLQQLLRHHGIDLENSLGTPFDPRRHEAIATGRDPSMPDHSVIEVSQPGYRRGEDVFRPAKVVVNDLSKRELHYAR